MVNVADEETVLAEGSLTTTSPVLPLMVRVIDPGIFPEPSLVN